MLCQLDWEASFGFDGGQQHDQDDNEEGDDDAEDVNGASTPVNLRLKLFRKDELIHFVRESGYKGALPSSFRVVNHWDDPHPIERRRASDMRRARQKAGLVVEAE